MHNPTLSASTLESGDSPPVDFSQLYLLLREKIWMIILCSLCGATAAWVKIHYQHPVYSATSVVHIEPHSSIVNFGNEHPPLNSVDSQIPTYLELFRSHRFLEEAALEIATKVPANDARQAIPRFDQATLLGKTFEVSQRKGTQLLDVTARNEKPEYAQQIANGITRTFLRHYQQQKAESVKFNMESLLTETARLKQHLQKSEETLQAYLEANNAVSLDEKQDTVTSALKIQANNLALAHSTRIRLQTDVADMDRFENNPEKLLTVTSIAQHTSVTTQRNLINGYLSNISSLRLRYTEKHPKLIQALQQLSDAEHTLNRIILQIPKTVRSELERSIATEHNFENAMKEQELLSLSLNRQSISYSAIARDVETDRGLYQAILRRLKESDVEKGIQVQNLQLFEIATLPTEPESQKKTKTVLLGLFAGCAISCFTILLISIIRDSYSSLESIEDSTGLPVFASIPVQKRSQKGKRVPEEDPYSQPAVLEGFRSLRTGLYLNNWPLTKKCFLFTSALPEDGKSFCSAGYATALAQKGTRTLLIDADLRRPSLSKLLLKTEPTQGLLGVLNGHIKLQQAIRDTPIANLYLLPAGAPAKDAPEILTHASLCELLSEAKPCFDAIVIDCAPVLPVSDTLLICSAVDSTCMVVRYGVTPKKAVMRALHLLAKSGAALDGIVFNAVSAIAIPSYYAYPQRLLPIDI